MISIDVKTNYKDITNTLEDIYISYLTKDFKQPLMSNNLTKVNTPLFYIGEDLIDPQYIDNYRKALLFIGKCHKEVPLNKKLIDTRDFSNREIIYKHREFGYIPKPLKFSCKKLIEISFSASSFRLMCIKAEIAVFLYYLALTKVIGKDFENYPEEVQFILGAFEYALNGYHTARNNIKGMAVYIWELTTFINVFANLTEKTENEWAMPFHHVFQSTRRYGSIADFGDYNYFTEQLFTSPGEEEFYSHLSKVPKCPTNIPFNNDIWFYIPPVNDVKPLCTACFNAIFNDIREYINDFKLVASELCRITEYESSFLLSKDEKYAEGCEFFFDSDEEANDFIKTVNIPPSFNRNNLYFCLMIKENNHQELKIFK